MDHEAGSTVFWVVVVPVIGAVAWLGVRYVANAVKKRRESETLRR